MKQKILSIHTGHDASIAYWEDYEQIAIFKEERLNRIKNWGRAWPELSFKKIQEYVNLKDIDVLLLGRGFFHTKYFKENIIRETKKLIKSLIGKKEKFTSISIAMRLNNTQNEFDVFDVKSFLKDFGFRDDMKVMFLDHHQAHALPTLFYNPEWNNTLLYTSDGGGDGINYSFTYFDGKKLNVIYGGNDKLMKSWIPDSLGQMYGMVTEICGFKKNRHEGKITGLAAFGEPLEADTIINMYYIDEKIFRIMPKFKSYDELRNVLQNIYDKYGREVLSASAQIALEKLTVKQIKLLKEKYNFTQIGLAGGVCSNVKLNQRISEIEGIEDVFVFPPMTDEGLVVGYVLDYLLQRDGLEKWLKNRIELKDMYWGERFEVKENDIPDGLQIIATNDIVEKAVELLMNKKICALYSAKMEYGPRALGARSILIDPSDRSINETVNKRLDRTEFMPFAPYVLEEMVEDVFEVTKSNKKAMQFMTITTNVKEKWKEKIKATVHVDGTARPQTIRREQNSIYYDILKTFYKKTGIPCLVNTSFNAHEEPIINTPQEAFNALLNDRVDYIIFENMIVGKN
jgi:carbamoyltransferase